MTEAVTIYDSGLRHKRVKVLDSFPNILLGWIYLPICKSLFSLKNTREDIRESQFLIFRDFFSSRKFVSQKFLTLKYLFFSLWRHKFWN